MHYVCTCLGSTTHAAETVCKTLHKIVNLSGGYYICSWTCLFVVLHPRNMYGQIRTVHTWELYSDPPLWNQATSTMTWYPTTLSINYKVIGLIDQGLNSWDSNPPLSQNGRRTLYSFGHPVWSAEPALRAYSCSWTCEMNITDIAEPVLEHYTCSWTCV